jgi:hypothetical protein
MSRTKTRRIVSDRRPAPVARSQKPAADALTVTDPATLPDRYIVRLEVVPTTIAGVVALLTYAAEFAHRGNMWPYGYLPEHPKTRWDREYGVSWEVILHQNLARALPSIAAA